MAKKKDSSKKVEIKTSEVGSGTVKGTGPIFELNDEEFKQWCCNTFLQNKGDSATIDNEFAKHKNLVPEDMDKLLERQIMYNEALDNLMLYMANEEKAKHPEVFVDPATIDAPLEDVEVPYGIKIIDMDSEMLDEFLDWCIATGHFNEIEDCLYRDDVNYDKIRPGQTSTANRIYHRYCDKLENYGMKDEDERLEWESEVLKKHASLIESGKLSNLVEVDDGIYIPKPSDTRALNELGFYDNKDPELTMPDEEELKDIEPRVETVELTPNAREAYLKQTLNEFATVSADKLGVDGIAMSDDYDITLAAVDRVHKNPNIEPASKERIAEMFRRISNDDESYTHLTDEQLKGLFYLPKYARWYHRDTKNSPYKRDILADGYTDKDGNVERKDDESIKMAELKKIRNESQSYVLNALTMAVDTLHPKLIEFSKSLSKEEMSMLSIIFQAAQIEFNDLHINHTGFAPATSELMITELYEILESMDETLIPGVKVAYDVVFYLDKTINSKDAKHLNVTELVYKTLIDLAYIGFINTNMTEYIYTATALSMAVEYFTKHPLYKYVDHITGQEVIVNMLDRINARIGDKVASLGHSENITNLEDQLVNEVNNNNMNNNLGGEEMIRIEAPAAAAQAVSGIKQNTGLDPKATAAPFVENNTGSVWGDAGKTNTVTYPASKPGVKLVHKDGTPLTNLFPKRDEAAYKKLLAGDTSGRLAAIPNGQYQAIPIPGNYQPAAQVTAVLVDPNIDRDISIGSGNLNGLPDFRCTEEFYYINPTEVAVKYQDGRVFVVNAVWIPLMQEIYSMNRAKLQERAKATGGFLQPSIYGTTDRIDFGLWNDFPPHIRYKVSNDHDNVWRVEIANNNNFNNNLGGNEMGKTINGMEGFGMMNNGMTAAGAAMAGIPTAMNTVMSQPMMNMGGNMNTMTTTNGLPQYNNNVYSAQLGAAAQPNMSMAQPMMAGQANNNAIIAALQAQVAILQQQVQALQAQVNNMRMTQMQQPVNSMATQANAFNPYNNGISMYTAASAQPMNNMGFQQTPAMMTPSLFNNNTSLIGGPVQVSNNGYQTPAVPQFNSGVYNPITPAPMMQQPVMNNGYNTVPNMNFSSPTTQPLMNSGLFGAPMFNTTLNTAPVATPAPAYNMYGQNVVQPVPQPTQLPQMGSLSGVGMQNVAQPLYQQPYNPQSAVPNGYNQTAGGYYYTVGLTQNPYMMQAQGINPTTGAYLNTNPASLPTAKAPYSEIQNINGKVVIN